MPVGVGHQRARRQTVGGQARARDSQVGEAPGRATRWFGALQFSHDAPGPRQDWYIYDMRRWAFGAILVLSVVAACDPQTAAFNATVTSANETELCLRSTRDSDAPVLAFGKTKCFPRPASVTGLKVGDCVRVVSDSFAEEGRELLGVELDPGDCD